MVYTIPNNHLRFSPCFHVYILYLKHVDSAKIFCIQILVIHCFVTKGINSCMILYATELRRDCMVGSLAGKCPDI